MATTNKKKYKKYKTGDDCGATLEDIETKQVDRDLVAREALLILLRGLKVIRVQIDAMIEALEKILK